MLRTTKSNDGQYLTLALFWEHRHENYDATFTTKEQDIERDGVTYYSLRKLYLEWKDPTEYLFATEVIGSWDHWQKICKSYALKPEIQKWRAELEIKLRAESIKAIRQTATEEGSKGTAAAKYMAEKGWEKRAGRPSKAEIERQKKIYAGISDQIEDDAERLGIH